MDTLNSVLINSMVFAFVPMLTAVAAAERAALFHRLRRGFTWVFSGLALAVIVSAPWLMRALAPGLDAPYFSHAVNILRILALSILATGLGAVQASILYTDRRFGPAAFSQAVLNICTIVAAWTLWKAFGVYAFAVGYAAGAWVQLAIVSWFARGQARAGAATTVRWRDLLTRPSFFLIYAAGLALNITFTRAYATNAGSGMAAALDYCMRGVGVPMALMVNPITNSLLPEIARLRSLSRLKEAFRLIDKTVFLSALAVGAGCVFALLFRRPAIALFFERGNFTPESTALVSAVFLGMGPCIVGWTLIEIEARSLFALHRPWPAIVAALVPLALNVAITFSIHSQRPEFIGLGASIGLGVGFLILIAIMRRQRAQWLAEG
jgi:putative peptidoglycan lipid II flippase